jgi:hypothetical protein
MMTKYTIVYLKKIQNKNYNVEYSFKENSKYSKQNKSIYTSKDLKEFISNLNKFSLNSAFDHKGSKSFLHSKKIALKEINLEENIISDEGHSEKEIKHYKDSKINAKSCKGLTKRSRRNTVICPENIAVSDIKKNTQSPKKRHKDNNLLKVIDNNKLKNKNRSAKLCSDIELKMYQDKDLNKIHPIKTFNENKNKRYKSCNDLTDSLHTKANAKKSNSTLIDLVNEISQNNSEI